MIFLGNKSTWITSETPTNKLSQLWHDPRSSSSQDLYMVIQFPNNKEICWVRNFK